MVSNVTNKYPLIKYDYRDQIFIVDKLYFYIIYNLGNYISEYNHSKKHGNLTEYLTPYVKLEKVTEVLSKYNRPNDILLQNLTLCFLFLKNSLHDYVF